MFWSKARRLSELEAEQLETLRILVDEQTHSLALETRVLELESLVAKLGNDLRKLRHDLSSKGHI